MGSVVGVLPDWLSVDFVRNASGALIIAAILAILIVMFLVRSIGTRLVVVILLGAAVAGLVRYRTTLDHCDQTACECKLFGEDVPGGGCRSTQ
ncbi:MAG TPA: hypothetical protein VFR41_10690 [Acidimicrobiia bacterium]|nr:hypothetical protein [Acidimicrobiia bacterium]